MISDVLFEAMEDIRRYQREMPDIYGDEDIKQSIDDLVVRMDEVRQQLDELTRKRLAAPPVEGL